MSDIAFSKPKMIGCCPASPNFFGRKRRGREARLNYGDEIMLRYEQQGQTPDVIAKHFGITPGLVRTIIRERGGRILSISERKRVYSLNEDFFSCIDTEEKAYILGFIYADGSVSPEKGTLCISQSKPDLQILEKIKTSMGSSSPVHVYINSRSNMNRKPTAILSIHSKKLLSDLSRHGCVKNKTFKTSFPFHSLSSDLYRHFIRGYFDGDGSIAMPLAKKPRPNAIIVGTEEMLSGIAMATSIVFCSVHYSMYTRHPERNHNIRQMHINRAVDAGRFLWWIYHDASIFMARKRDRYMAVMRATIDRFAA